MPGTPSKPPYGGFHAFQVFVIFPIYKKPWDILCKKIIEGSQTYFQPGATFACSGRVAGLLDHKIMIKPPRLEEDYILIIVPDTWHGEPPGGAATARAPAGAAVTTPSKGKNLPQESPTVRSKWAKATPSKRKAAAVPVTPASPDPFDASNTSSIADSQPLPPSSTQRSEPQTPSKKPRLAQLAVSSTDSSQESLESLDELDELQVESSIKATDKGRPGPPTASQGAGPATRTRHIGKKLQS